MKTIKIRELRGSILEESARAGELVGLTRDRALIAVVIPMIQAWIEHVIDHNWSRLIQSANNAENHLASAAPYDSIDDVLLQASEADKIAPLRHRTAVTREQSLKSTIESSVQHLAAEAEKVTSALGPVGAPAAEMIRRLSAAFGLARPGEPDITSTCTIGVRDLSARRIEEAGENRELLMLTNDRLLVGMVVPVSQRLVEFLVSQNLSRVMYNINVAEQASPDGMPFTDLDELISSDAHSREVTNSPTTFSVPSEN